MKEIWVIIRENYILFIYSFERVLSGIEAKTQNVSMQKGLF